MEEHLRQESYENLGGINQKVSKYITPKTEFINLENVDFRITGALHTFAGTGRYQGTQNIGRITGLASFFALGPTFSYGSATYTLIATGTSQAFNITGQTAVLGSTAVSFYDYLFPNNTTPFDFIPGTQVYACNQYDFFVYPTLGSTSTYQFVTYAIGSSVFGSTVINTQFNVLDFGHARQYSLPRPYLPQGLSAAGFSSPNGISGIYDLYFAFTRSDGFIGPALHCTFQSDFFATITINNAQINPFIADGIRNVGFNDFSVLGVYCWIKSPSSSLVLVNVPNMVPGFTAVHSPTQAIFSIGMSGGVLSPLDFVPGFTTPNIDVLGTFAYGLNESNGSTIVFNSVPVAPSTIELYNNQMFFSGFFDDPDVVWFSNIGEYELRDPENFFSVRYKDGDIVTCIKTFFTQLVLFKTGSISVLTGDNPENFALTDVTNQFGCLNSQCAVTWNQKLWFLDPKGICEYNGADTKIVSDKMESTFQRMNVGNAKKVASGTFVKERNEIWFAIPLDGNQYNNVIVVYDYIADAWTTRAISTGTALTVTKDITQKQTALSGGALGQVLYYHDDIYIDSLSGGTVGFGFTQVIRARFLSDMGHSVEKQFRRLFADFDVAIGGTMPMLVNFYKDQGSSPYLSMTMMLNQWQNRIDFGIPATDLSVEFIYTGTSAMLFNGFTIEYRFQRAVPQNNG